jgi:transposase
MSKGEHRRFTAEQKIEILREAEQPGVTVSEVCRRHGLAPSVFYRWRAVAQGGSAVALKRDAQRTPRKNDVEVRQKAQIERMQAVIAEITAENLELKKRSEVGGFISCTGGEQGSGDANRCGNEKALGVAGV